MTWPHLLLAIALFIVVAWIVIWDSRSVGRTIAEELVQPEIGKVEWKASAEHPAPWTTSARGGGSVDVYDARSVLVTSVRCRDVDDHHVLHGLVDDVNYGS